MFSGAVGEKGGDRDADECVCGVPYQVEAGNFVRDELCREHGATYDENRPAPEHVEALRKRDPLEAGENAEREDGGIEIDSCGEAGSDYQTTEVGWRERDGGREVHGWHGTWSDA